MALLPARLNKPEYLLRPSRLARRLTKAHSRGGLPARTVHMIPWGLEIELWDKALAVLQPGGMVDLGQSFNGGAAATRFTLSIEPARHCDAIGQGAGGEFLCECVHG